jgi:hypothetical protein
LVGIHNQVKNRSVQVNNPIIIINNSVLQTAENQIGNDLYYEYDMYYAYDTMYNISADEYDDFVQEFQLEDQIAVNSNVLDVYNHNWEIIARNMRLISVISLFLMMLEISLIGFIIHLEYQFNSMEMALKKVYGYALFERNARIIRVTMLVFLLSVSLAVCLSFLSEIRVGIGIFGGGVSLLLCEMFFIVKKAKSIEKARLSRILKGGRI